MFYDEKTKQNEENNFCHFDFVRKTSPGARKKGAKAIGARGARTVKVKCGSLNALASLCRLRLAGVVLRLFADAIRPRARKYVFVGVFLLWLVREHPSVSLLCASGWQAGGRGGAEAARGF